MAVIYLLSKLLLRIFCMFLKNISGAKWFFGDILYWCFREHWSKPLKREPYFMAGGRQLLVCKEVKAFHTDAGVTYKTPRFS